MLAVVIVPLRAAPVHASRKYTMVHTLSEARDILRKLVPLHLHRSISHPSLTPSLVLVSPTFHALRCLMTMVSAGERLRGSEVSGLGSSAADELAALMDEGAVDEDKSGSLVDVANQPNAVVNRSPLHIFMLPGKAEAWHGTVTHNQGVVRGKRGELLVSEMDRILKYSGGLDGVDGDGDAPADLLPPSAVLEYLERRDDAGL